jgi:hypothetical protein
MAPKRKTATTHRTTPSIAKEARAAVGREHTRDRVRELTVRALRERDLGRTEISGLVREVLEGASGAVDESIPAARSSVLRQVFDGLSEAVNSAASAGATTVRSAQKRGRDLADHAVPNAAARIRAANEEFLHAVSLFAKRTSSGLGEELEAMVKRARRTGGQVSASTRAAASAADGRLMELTGEAARAGVTVARRAAGELAMAASGLLEGLGQVVTPRKAPVAARSAPRPVRKPRAGKAKPPAAKRAKKTGK